MAQFAFEDTLFLRPEWIKHGSFCKLYVKNKQVFGVDYYLELQNVRMENLNLQIEEQNDDSSEEDEIIQLVKMKSLNDEIKQRETDDMDALPDIDVAKVTDGIASDEFVINADSDNGIDDETTKGNDEQ